MATEAADPLDALTLKHAKVQRLRRLLGRRSARVADGAFVVEGANVLAEALTAGPAEPATVAAFCNTVRTPGGGSHLTAAVKGLSEALADRASQGSTGITPYGPTAGGGAP